MTPGRLFLPRPTGTRLVGRAMTGEQFGRLIGSPELGPADQRRRVAAGVKAWVDRALTASTWWPTDAVRHPDGGTDIHSILLAGEDLEPWVQIWTAPGPMLRWVLAPAGLGPVPPIVAHMIQHLGYPVDALGGVDQPTSVTPPVWVPAAMLSLPVNLRKGQGPV